MTKTIKTKQTALAGVVKETVAVLEAGGLIIFPTETTYGAGVDATNQKAVDKLLDYKARREGKPLSIAVANQVIADQYVTINKQAKKLYERFLPGPVTVVSQVKHTVSQSKHAVSQSKHVVSVGKHKVAQGVESEFGTLGIRIPDYKLMLQILTAFGKPITATGANASGKKRPYTIQDVLNNLSNKQKNLIDLILDAGQLPKNEPSTVIDTTLSTPTTLRLGQIRPEAETQAKKSLLSRSEAETKKIAGTLMLKNWNQTRKTGLVIGLSGPLGAGKTIFTKGVAEFLKIKETITSPTYSYLQSYGFVRHGVSGQLHHLDLWKIDQVEVLKRLEIEKLLKPNNVIVIEWWQQKAKYLEKLVTKYKLPLLKIEIQERANNVRNLGSELKFRTFNMMPLY